MIDSIENARSNDETINLGSGINASVIEIVEILKKHYGSQSEIKITDDFRIGDMAHNKADISKAKKILNFEPTISFDDGLRAFCSWVEGQDNQSMSEKGMLRGVHFQN